MARAQLLDLERNYSVWKVKRPLRPTQYYFGTEHQPYRVFSRKWYVDAHERQATEPVKLHSFNVKSWWWFQKQVYVESEGLTSEDVAALALQRQRTKENTLRRAHAEHRGEQASRSERPREPIPEHVRAEVWRRDQGRCVDCGSREQLEFDHVVPWSEGGSNTARNIELRCESCNRAKGSDI
jgi:5-methylcytosine-specific restriction endonuclease McrA